MIENNVYPIKYSDYIDINSASFVYVLICPIRGEIFYIGKANDAQSRYRKHITQIKSITLKNNYIKWILSQNKKPKMLIVFGGDEQEALKKEIYLIELYKNNSFLKNMTAGGDGGNTMAGRFHTQQSKDKIGQSKIGRSRDLSYINTLKRKPVLQLHPITNDIIAEFESISKASKITGFCKSNIARLSNGTAKKSVKFVGGYKWKYKTNQQRKNNEKIDA